MEKEEEIYNKVLFGSSVFNLLVFISALTVVLYKTSFQMYSKLTILLTIFLVMFIMRGMMDLQRLSWLPESTFP